MKSTWAAAILVTLAALGPYWAEAADAPNVVHCHDETLDTVQETLSGDCTGKVVGDEEADVIKQKRRDYIQGVLSKPSAANVEGKRLAGAGSGFFVAADGSLVTNHHVVADCAVVSISPTFGEMTRATVVSSDEETDLALLHADLVPPGVASFTDSEGSINRAAAYVVGYPNQGLVTIEPVLTPVEVLGSQKTAFNMPAIVIKGEVRLGNSGGPLLDSGGGVIGAVFAKVNTVQVHTATGQVVQDIGLVLPSETVRTFLDAQGVDYRVGLQRAPQPESRLLLDARPFVAQVGCWQ